LERFQRRSKGVKGRGGIFAGGKFNELGRPRLVLREREIVRVKGIRGMEIKTGAILLDQAMEHGLYVAPNSGAIRC